MPIARSTALSKVYQSRHRTHFAGAHPHNASFALSGTPSAFPAAGRALSTGQVSIGGKRNGTETRRPGSVISGNLEILFIDPRQRAGMDRHREFA